MSGFCEHNNDKLLQTSLYGRANKQFRMQKAIVMTCFKESPQHLLKKMGKTVKNNLHSEQTYSVQAQNI
jgi:hypothetical protein